MNDDDIPVLRDAVSRRSGGRLSQEQLDEICDIIRAETDELLNNLTEEALNEIQNLLQRHLNERLNEELPELVNKVVRKELDKNN